MHRSCKRQLSLWLLYINLHCLWFFFPTSKSTIIWKKNSFQSINHRVFKNCLTRQIQAVFPDTTDWLMLLQHRSLSVGKPEKQWDAKNPGQNLKLRRPHDPASPPYCMILSILFQLIVYSSDEHVLSTWDVLDTVS